MAKQKQLFGRWRVDRRLNAGGQAEVFKVYADGVQHTPPAALKLYYPPTEQARARISREHDLLSSMMHPGVIAVRDVGEHDGRPFIVLELATCSLTDIFAESASAGRRVLQRSPGLLLGLFRQACEGVDAMHQQGVLHRDLKPDNILLIDEAKELFRAVVADLGIAAEEDGQGSITKTHEVVGTPKWRAPELAVGGKATAASDVFGLGRILEFLMTGQAPDEMRPRPVPAERGLSVALRAHLDDVIARALAHDPRHRMTTVRDLLDALPMTCVSIVGEPTPKRSTRELEFDDVDRAVLGWLTGEAGVDSEITTWEVWQRLSEKLDKVRLRVSIKRLEERKMLTRVHEVGPDGDVTLFRVEDAALDLVSADVEDIRKAMRVVFASDDPLAGLDL